MAENINNTLQYISNNATEQTSLSNDNSYADICTHRVISNIVNNFEDSVPQIVVLGDSGSGKSFLYKHMLTQKTWENFVSTVNGTPFNEPPFNGTHNAVFVPVLSISHNETEEAITSNCLFNANSKLNNVNLTVEIVNENANFIKNVLEEQTDLSEFEWKNIWRKMILNMLDSKYKEFSDAEEELKEKGKKVIFLIDGLDDLFMPCKLQGNDSWKRAFSSLCQGIINEIRYQENIGIIIFARTETAEKAIRANVAQFKSQYLDYEL